MYKFMSWLIIAFIGLVPLGAFFDTKQPPKPNMEQFFMKRQKRDTNSSQCGGSCNLKFSEVLNSSLVLDFVNGSVFFGSLSLPNLNFPNDVHSSVFNINDFVLFETIYSFFRDNGVKNGKILMIEKLLKLEISLNKIDYGSYGYEITSFSAEIPNKN
jgi:hypothetical protein